MKVLILIMLMSVTGLAQAYSVFWDLKDSSKFKDYTFAEGEDIVTWGVNNSLGEGVSITYSFSDEDYLCGNLDNCSPIQSADYQAIISDAFDAWAEVANLSFSQVEAQAQAGDIVVAYSNISNVENDGINYNVLGEASVGRIVQYNVESEKVASSYLSNNGIFLI